MLPTSNYRNPLIGDTNHQSTSFSAFIPYSYTMHPVRNELNPATPYYSLQHPFHATFYYPFHSTLQYPLHSQTSSMIPYSFPHVSYADRSYPTMIPVQTVMIPVQTVAGSEPNPGHAMVQTAHDSFYTYPTMLNTFVNIDHNQVNQPIQQGLSHHPFMESVENMILTQQKTPIELPKPVRFTKSKHAIDFNRSLKKRVNEEKECIQRFQSLHNEIMHWFNGKNHDNLLNKQQLHPENKSIQTPLRHHSDHHQLLKEHVLFKLPLCFGGDFDTLHELTSWRKRSLIQSSEYLPWASMILTRAILYYSNITKWDEDRVRSLVRWAYDFIQKRSIFYLEKEDLLKSVLENGDVLEAAFEEWSELILDPFLPVLHMNLAQLDLNDTDDDDQESILRDFLSMDSWISEEDKNRATDKDRETRLVHFCKIINELNKDQKKDQEIFDILLRYLRWNMKYNYWIQSTHMDLMFGPKRQRIEQGQQNTIDSTIIRSSMHTFTQTIYILDQKALNDAMNLVLFWFWKKCGFDFLVELPMYIPLADAILEKNENYFFMERDKL